MEKEQIKKIEKEQERQSQIIKQIFSFLKERAKSVYESEMVLMGLEQVIDRVIEKKKEEMLTSDLLLDKTLDPTNESHKIYIDLYNLIGSETVSATENELLKLRTMISASLERKSQDISLDDIDLNKVM